MKRDISLRLPWVCVCLTLLAVACPKKTTPPATCTTNAQCPTGQMCSSGACVTALPCGGICKADEICLNNSCLPAEGANCASSASICPMGFTCGPSESCERQCMMNSDCPLSTAPVCNINMFVCAQCSINSDCTSPGKPVCSADGTCIQCGMDTDCYVNSVGAGQYCDTASSTCKAGCLTVTDCQPGTKTCTGTGTTAGRCVDCESDTDCTSLALPVCNTTTAQCVECLADTDCSGTTGQCDPTTNQCVECVENSICPRGQVCLSDVCANGCVGGTGGANCPSATPICDTTSGTNGTCVACLADTDCPVAEVCSTDPAGAKECVPGCKTDDRCQGSGSTTPYCDPTANAGFGECVQCVRNDQCTNNEICDPTGMFCRCHGAGESCETNADCGYEVIATDQDGGATHDCNALGAACINVVRCGATSDSTYHIINAVCSQAAQGLPDQCPANPSPSYTHCPAPPVAPTNFVTEFAGYDPSASPNTSNEAAVSYSHMCVPEANECTTCD